jgi:diphthamide biosynthesis protein 2
MTNKILVGGLLVDSFILHSLDHLIIYIGDKDEQLVNIYLNLSQHTILSYSPITRVLTTQVGSQSKEFSQRTGGMLKVKDATTIGIIIGSMGLTGKVTQDIVNRVKILIHESGKKHYTFAMGRLNEAKLSNFPEVDIFCLIGNDDNSIIPAK